jgi:hypothetical protein
MDEQGDSVSRAMWQIIASVKAPVGKPAGGWGSALQRLNRYCSHQI